MQTLAEYIEAEHNGNQSAFAASLGVARNQVQQWLKAKKPVYVVDGKLVQVIREL